MQKASIKMTSSPHIISPPLPHSSYTVFRRNRMQITVIANRLTPEYQSNNSTHSPTIPLLTNPQRLILSLVASLLSTSDAPTITPFTNGLLSWWSWLLETPVSHLYRFSRMPISSESIPQWVSVMMGVEGETVAWMYLASMMMRNRMSGMITLSMQWNLWYQIRYTFITIFCFSFFRCSTSSLCKYSLKYLQANDPSNSIASLRVEALMQTMRVMRATLRASAIQGSMNSWQQRWEKKRKASADTRYTLSRRMVFLDFSFRILSFSFNSLLTSGSAGCSEMSSSQYTSCRVLVYQCPNLITAGISTRLTTTLSDSTSKSTVREFSTSSVMARPNTRDKCLRKSLQTSLMRPSWAEVPSRLRANRQQTTLMTMEMGTLYLKLYEEIQKTLTPSFRTYPNRTRKTMKVKDEGSAMMVVPKT